MHLGHSRDKSASPLVQHCVVAADKVVVGFFFKVLTAITLISGDVSLHFQNLLTSSWQRLVQRLDENVRH